MRHLSAYAAPLSFGNPDWMQLAAAFGWQGLRITNSGELADGLRQAFATAGPSLMVVPTDYRENMKLSRRLGELTCAI